jgi:aminopeptidase N
MLISVTLKWWDDLWLNEGFASYMEYKGVNHAHPDWQIVCMSWTVIRNGQLSVTYLSLVS